MTTRKVFVGGRTDAAIVCSKCGNVRMLKVHEIDDLTSPFSMTCGCGFRFDVTFEWRRYYRKATNLVGYYSKAGGPRGRMIVEDLSKSGLGFKTDEKNNIKQGDLLNVEFVLDTERKPMIRSAALVHRVADRSIGAEFHSLDEHTRKEIGFYLMI